MIIDFWHIIEILLLIAGGIIIFLLGFIAYIIWELEKTFKEYAD